MMMRRTVGRVSVLEKGEHVDRERSPFEAALIRYRRARSWLGRKPEDINIAVAKIDKALDELMAVPSPSLGAFGEKIRILEAEYGLFAQPRHLKALYVDVAALVALYACTFLQVVPGG
jgi:hypothetical protein